MELRYSKEGEKEAGPLRHLVRVMMLTATPAEGDLRHPSNVLSFILLKNNKAKWWAPGGAYDGAVDGADPYSDATLQATAIRTVKAQMNVDLGHCKFHRFMEAFFETGAGPIRMVYLLPEVWGVEGGFHAATQLKEDIIEYVDRTEEEHALTEEDIAKFHEEWAVALEKEKAAAEAEVEGEREVDRLDRLQRFSEHFRAKEANPPQPPATKKTVVEVPKQNIIKHTMVTPFGAPVAELAEYHQHTYFSTEDFNSTFEVKLFALCFDEWLRGHFGARILEWLQALPTRQAGKEKRTREADPPSSAKRCRTEGEMGSDTAIVSEPAVSADGSGRAAAEPGEEATATAATAAMEAEEGREAPPTPKPKTRTVLVEDPAQMEPFFYFDSSVEVRSFHVQKERLETLLLATAPLCFREVEDLLKPLAPFAAGATQFNYSKACSHATEVPIPDSPKPIPAPTPVPATSPLPLCPPPKEAEMTEALETVAPGVAEGAPAAASAEPIPLAHTDAAQEPATAEPSNTPEALTAMATCPSDHDKAGEPVPAVDAATTPPPMEEYQPAYPADLPERRIGDRKAEKDEPQDSKRQSEEAAQDQIK